jgi:5-methyltetrahydrofolate--homocysteine methyltransferase
MGHYVVDFVCHRANLVIEVDGGVHQRPDVAVRDLARDAWLISQGYTVLRFTTQQVENDIDGVVRDIRNAASNRLKQVI